MKPGPKPVEERFAREIALSEHMSTLASKGGKASSAKMTPEQRSERAKKAVAAREAKRSKNAGTAAKR
jgi:hypothetical protein